MEGRRGGSGGKEGTGDAERRGKAGLGQGRKGATAGGEGTWGYEMHEKLTPQAGE